MIRLIFTVTLFAVITSLGAQHKASRRAQTRFANELKKNLPQHAGVLKNARNYRLEIIYGQVNTDKNGAKKVTFYQYGRPNLYFYPASIVKFPVAVKLMEWLSFENISNLQDMFVFTEKDTACGYTIGDAKRHYYGKAATTLHPKDFVTFFKDQISKTIGDSLWMLNDSIGKGTIVRLTREPGPVNVGDMMYEMLVQSDNSNYNLLYEAIAARPSGIDKYFYIPKPFIPCTNEYISHGAHFYLYGDKWKTLPGGKIRKQFSGPVKSQLIGIAQLTGDNDTIVGGRNFATHNHVSLLNTLTLLKDIVYPSRQAMVTLSAPNRSTLLKYLASNPTERLLATDKEYLNASFSKTNFLFPHSDTSKALRGRFYNIIGQAYGFSSDVLYYCNPAENVEFFLALRIYTNADGVLNDNAYEYETIALPLMRDVFEYICRLEKGRKKITPPNTLLSFPETR